MCIESTHCLSSCCLYNSRTHKPDGIYRNNNEKKKPTSHHFASHKCNIAPNGMNSVNDFSVFFIYAMAYGILCDKHTTMREKKNFMKTILELNIGAWAHSYQARTLGRLEVKSKRIVSVCVCVVAIFVSEFFLLPAKHLTTILNIILFLSVRFGLVWFSLLADLKRETN